LVAGQSSCALSPANSTGLSSGGKASLNKTATLTVAYTVPTLPTRLIAGSYSDTITLTITASP
jgi:spore coat protein U-like protein